MRGTRHTNEEKGEACRSAVWNQVKYQTVRDIARTVGEESAILH
jgi:hypothetical protein